MPSTDRVAVSRTVKADPAAVFRVVTDPRMHVEIDGSGMLEAAPGARPLKAVGDTFEMDMDRESLGDIPMGKYKVLNTVTKIVPDALLEWNVGTEEHGAFGHVYGWEITPAGDRGTEVTNYCDWSGIPDSMRDRVAFPVVPVAMLQRSVDNLVALVSERPSSVR